jgi:hypothetical protein
VIINQSSSIRSLLPQRKYFSKSPLSFYFYYQKFSPAAEVVNWAWRAIAVTSASAELGGGVCGCLAAQSRYNKQRLYPSLWRS